MTIRQIRSISHDALRRSFRLQALRANRMHLEANLRNLDRRREQLEQQLRDVEAELALLTAAMQADRG